MAHNMFVGSGKRSGTRGGADQFSWDKVKGDKYKDFYLGHSLHTTAKPTFNNRKPNPLWWTKSQSGAADDDQARRRAEIEAIKREEEQLHLEALGLAPRRRKAQENQLDATEIQELTRRGNTERDAYDAERVAGLGYAPAPQHQLDAEGGLVDPKGRAAEDKEEQGGGGGGGGVGEREEAAGQGRTGDKEEEEWVEVKAERSKKRSKEERREDKQQRKEEKKRDKREKRERKGRKDQHRADRHAAVDSDRRREHRRDHEGGDQLKRPHRDHDRPRDSSTEDHQPYRRHRHHRESVRSSARSPSPKRVRRHDSPSPPRSRCSRSS